MQTLHLHTENCKLRTCTLPTGRQPWLRSRRCRWQLRQSMSKHKSSAQTLAATSDVLTSDRQADEAHDTRSHCPFGGNGNQLLHKAGSTAIQAPTQAETPRLSVSMPPRDYLAFKDEAYKIDLRLERIAIDDIFEIDEEYDADMKRKALMLATRPAEMMLPTIPGCEAAQQEVLALTVKVLTDSFPDRFQLQGSQLTNKATGEMFDIADKQTNPMSIVARLVQEDVVVMQKINGRLIMSCGAVVSPLGWSGSRKVGLDLAGIHEPVPHFADGGALKYVSKIFERGLKAEVPLSRANWFILHTSELSLFADAEHIPVVPEQGPITPDNAGERLFLRCERQVATRLPLCGGVMFSFKTYLRPLKALEQRTEVMQRLLAAFLALPEEVVAYRKAWHDMSTRDVAIQYLQRVANQY